MEQSFLANGSHFKRGWPSYKCFTLNIESWARFVNLSAYNHRISIRYIARDQIGLTRRVYKPSNSLSNKKTRTVNSLKVRDYFYHGSITTAIQIGVFFLTRNSCKKKKEEK